MRVQVRRTRGPSLVKLKFVPGLVGPIGPGGVITTVNGETGTDVTLDGTHIEYEQDSVNAVPLTVEARFRMSTHVREFGAIGTPIGGTTSDQTTALRNAIAFAEANGRDLELDVGIYDVFDNAAGYNLNIGQPIRIVGKGNQRTWIRPTNGGGISCIKVTPPTNAFIEGLVLDGFAIADPFTGTRNGSYGILLDGEASTGTHFSHMSFRDLYVGLGSVPALRLLNDTHAGGGVFLSNFVNCSFRGGVSMMGIGDSNVFLNCSMDGTGVGFEIDSTAGAGSNALISCNITTPITALIHYARNFRMIDCNIETLAGTGSTAGAIIDILGDLGRCNGIRIIGCHIGAIGASSPTSLVRVHNAANTRIEGGTMQSGVAGVDYAVDITADADDTQIGPFAVNAGGFTTAVVNDAGVGTRGVRKPLTLNATYYSGGSPAVKKSMGGRVSLESGLITATGAVNTTRICTLPEGFRPSSNLYLSAITNDTTYAPRAMFIGTNGEVFHLGADTVTQVTLDGLAFDTDTITYEDS